MVRNTEDGRTSLRRGNGRWARAFQGKRDNMEITEGVRFDTLGLSPEIMRALEKRNIEVSTPVQAGCIPPMMRWEDVIAKAPTGTGKTFAYGTTCFLGHFRPLSKARGIDQMSLAIWPCVRGSAVSISCPA